MMKEIYVSIDIEADGPIPGENNMLSFGAAAFDLTSPTPRIPIATFSANLELLDPRDWPRVHQNKDTMDWWSGQPEAWKACRADLKSPKNAMPSFVGWCKALPGKPVIVGYPVTYDFTFLYWYTMVFGKCKRSPFGFQGLDIKTLIAERLNVPYKMATKQLVKKKRRRWFDGSPKHNHEALTDAIGQGILFVNIKNDK
jgi:hypothetical protein